MAKAARSLSNKAVKPAASRKSWGGRLAAEADQTTAKFVSSLDVDTELWRYDIVGSVAHARMLSETGIITRKEFARIKAALIRIAADIEQGRLPMPLELEDIHMVIEKALIDRTGNVGAKLHTGRSRNDQVATDLRLWARDAIDNLLAGVRTMQKALVELAKKQGQVVMPAYTHLQRAQPVLAGHTLLAYAEMLHRDAQRLDDAKSRTNVSVLGCGAVAGSSLPLDRNRTAELLGFTDVARNSIDGTSDRDFLAELCFCCATIGGHLSRWAEDWIIFCTTEFGFIELSDAYCTSSSMMPQKKNPDTLELIRGKAAWAIAQLTGIMTLLKGLPLAYNRDLQDDKRFAFAAVGAIREALAVAAGAVATARLRPDRITRNLQDGFLDATAMAEYLVKKGIPFRKAHQMVANLVRQAETTGGTLAGLPLESMQAVCDRIAKDVYDCLGAQRVVNNYATDGAGGHRQLRKQLVFWTSYLKKV